MRQSWCGILLVILVAGTSCSVRQPSPSETFNLASQKQPIAPGKFIPTFAILYEGPKSQEALKAAAHFDMIDAGSHAVSDNTTWPALRRINPHLKIIIYEMGPGEYNTTANFYKDQGWDWISKNHGLNSADRWVAVGTHGGYLQSGKQALVVVGDSQWRHSWLANIFGPFSVDAKERLMLIENPNWQQYWLEGVYDRFFTPAANNRDADGVFADNTDYEWPSEDGWVRQGTLDEPEFPADYYHNGVYIYKIWKAGAKAFLARSVQWLDDRKLSMIPNFGYMAKDPKSWHDLDSQPHPVFAAMEEGAFATPWGAPGHFTFYSEEYWLHQVNAMRHLQHIRALMSVHGLVVSKKQDISRLDAADIDGANRGADILWFAITSFLQGYDDVRQNAYLGFTIWGYGHVFYPDEFDPTHLNLGRALGEMHRVDGAAGHCYVREFERGWAVVNPTYIPAKGIRVPTGSARVLDHHTFEKPESQPLVTSFDLPPHRGIILLKEGQPIGNADAASAPK